MIIDSDIFLDTNILVHYTFKDFEPTKHNECRKVIELLRTTKIQMNISTQVLREFYAVVTRKRYFKSPLEPKAAKDQILYFSSVFNVAGITTDVISRLIPLIEKYEIKGQDIHDATVVATMLDIGNDILLSYNKNDFSDFQEIKTIDPAELLNEWYPSFDPGQ